MALAHRYVDFSAGNDANDGTFGTAKKTIQDMLDDLDPVTDTTHYLIWVGNNANHVVSSVLDFTTNFGATSVDFGIGIIGWDVNGGGGAAAIAPTNDLAVVDCDTGGAFTGADHPDYTTFRRLNIKRTAGTVGNMVGSSTTDFLHVDQCIFETPDQMAVQVGTYSSFYRSVFKNGGTSATDDVIQGSIATRVVGCHVFGHAGRGFFMGSNGCLAVKSLFRTLGGDAIFMNTNDGSTVESCDILGNSVASKFGINVNTTAEACSIRDNYIADWDGTSSEAIHVDSGGSLLQCVDNQFNNNTADLVDSGAKSLMVDNTTGLVVVVVPTDVQVLDGILVNPVTSAARGMQLLGI